MSKTAEQRYNNRHSKESVILLPASRIFCESQVRLNKFDLYMDGNFPAARGTPLGHSMQMPNKHALPLELGLELGSPSFYHASIPNLGVLGF